MRYRRLGSILAGLSLRLLDDQPNLAFQQRPLVPVNRALDPAVRLLLHQRQQSDDDVGARRY
jgi:hypothetical protein